MHGDEVELTHYRETLSKIGDPGDKIDWLCDKLYKNELADRQRLLAWGNEKQALESRLKVLEDEEASEEAKKAEKKRQRKVWLGIISAAGLAILPQLYSTIEGLFSSEETVMEEAVEQDVNELIEQRLREYLGQQPQQSGHPQQQRQEQQPQQWGR